MECCTILFSTNYQTGRKSLIGGSNKVMDAEAFKIHPFIQNAASKTLLRSQESQLKVIYKKSYTPNVRKVWTAILPIIGEW